MLQFKQKIYDMPSESFVDLADHNHASLSVEVTMNYKVIAL